MLENFSSKNWKIPVKKFIFSMVTKKYFFTGIFKDFEQKFQNTYLTEQLWVSAYVVLILSQSIVWF